MENNQLRVILQKINPESVVKLIVSNKRNKEYNYNKIVISPVEKNGKYVFAVECFTDKRAFRSIMNLSELTDFLENELSDNFKQLDGILRDRNILIKISKKDKVP